VKYAWMTAHKEEFSVRAMCRALRVSRAAYYGFIERQPRIEAKRAPMDAALKELAEGRYTRFYGTPRATQVLRSQGFVVGRKGVAAARKRLGLTAKSRQSYRRTTDSRHTLPVAENRLARRFTPGRAAPKAWVGDISYLSMPGGFVYLATVLCLVTRRLVGYAVAQHMRTELVQEALQMAFTHTADAPDLWHSDRGSQYASELFGETLKARSIEASMSRKGDCWDNAVAESFFATFKRECGTHFACLDDAKRQVFDFYLFYNRERLHSSLGYLSPDCYALTLTSPAEAQALAP